MGMRCSHKIAHWGGIPTQIGLGVGKRVTRITWWVLGVGARSAPCHLIDKHCPQDTNMGGGRHAAHPTRLTAGWLEEWPCCNPGGEHRHAPAQPARHPAKKTVHYARCA